jgi:hypothetical protein
LENPGRSGAHYPAPEEEHPIRTPPEGSSWALPLALMAIIAIMGGLIAFAPSNKPAAEQREARQCASEAPVRNLVKAVSKDVGEETSKALEAYFRQKGGITTTSCP